MKCILKTKLNLYIVFLSVTVFLIGCSDDSDDDRENLQENESEIIEEHTPENKTCASGSVYLERDGMIRVDIENPDVNTNDWVTASSLTGFEGDGYLIWTGQDNFNMPGEGLIKFSVQISTPGTYQFVWSSRITQGTSNTDFNDSWLRIPTADDFYAEKAGGERVYPIGSGKGPNPEGAGADGWFKVYMNRVGEWFWRSSTSDRDPHDIFARFDAAGVYDIEISGRSRLHAIDQFVLFKTDLNLTLAQNAELSEIICK